MPELVVLAEQLLAPVPGGTGRYTGELLRALAETAPPGWTVSSVVARHADVEAAVVEGVEGPRVLPIPPRGLIAAWQLGLPWWPGGDAVHAPTPLAPARVPKGRTLSVAVHDTVPWTHPETLTPRGVAWHKAVIARAARRATALTVPTRAVADELAGLVPVSVPVSVIPHGVRPPAAFTEVELPERYVLAIGTIEPRKGIDVLIEAAGRIGTPLVLAGQPGWGGIDPMALAREHGADVRLLGKVSDAELAFALRGASVLAMPSRAEGFGLPLIEAMAVGVPVVHSDVPALVEVAGGAGVVVPVGDAQALANALEELLGHPEQAAALRDGGLIRSSEFTWRRAATALWALHQRD
ncbi:glycosyltransferase family 4 protein [Amycolatopsis regifaucium]|uniref:Glycosyl transferase n=1 Tax=Amycolatopsis regifaucium TaxID=546365 RepID=A0A154MDM5_9PSEU|nr:glycosyltransferase family 1 protein [Amycolatopsis regifaucium]KZB82612.1 glycosyl transferase [Amycolatopsis regifaucium]OKA10285.1 glycosyl transferase [Amycolatopsis regifaucium]SFG89710.1 Glycosyltransferase involved in cell wall bisynthesis [Amycolatopsis regifaucium]